MGDVNFWRSYHKRRPRKPQLSFVSAIHVNWFSLIESWLTRRRPPDEDLQITMRLEKKRSEMKIFPRNFVTSFVTSSTGSLVTTSAVVAVSFPIRPNSWPSLLCGGLCLFIYVLHTLTWSGHFPWTRNAPRNVAGVEWFAYLDEAFALCRNAAEPDESSAQRM